MDTLALADRTARSFALTIRLLPGAVREEVCLAYLVARLSDSVADTRAMAADARLDLLAGLAGGVANQCPWPVAALARLAENHDHAGEAGLLRAAGELEQLFLAQTGGALERSRHVLATIFSGQVLDLERFGSHGPAGLADESEMIDYAWRVAGCVGEFWTDVLAARLPGALLLPPDELKGIGRRYGQGLQLLNILRDAPADWADGRCYLPALAGESGEIPSPPDPAGLPVLHARMRARLGMCRDWLDDGTRYGEALRGLRVRAASRLPAVIGHQTLDHLEEAGPDAWLARVKISRRDVRRGIWTALTGWE